MNFRHAFVSLAALVGLAACSDEDTIVSLNVTASDAVPVIDTLRVTVTQGSKQHVAEFAPPTETPTAPEGEVPAAPSIKNSFFQRITLPGEWSESDATVAVEALHANGSPYSPPFSDDTVAVIQPEDVVAAYVQLDVPPEPPPSEGGAGGEGASTGTGGQSTGGQGTGGQGTGGQSTGGQSAGGDGGVGGASAAGAGGG
jgi:hypothetical protein